MKTYISLLRGINVGGHKKIPMDALAKVYEALGFNQCQSLYLKKDKSGNIGEKRLVYSSSLPY